MTDPNEPDQPTSEHEWTDALADQTVDAERTDDPWAEALQEQRTTDSEASATPTPLRGAAERVFKPLDKGVGPSEARDLDMIMDIPVKFTVELGRTRITIKQLLELTQGSVVELDGLAGEPMDILINGYLIAQGEVVVVEDRYGIRITEITTPSERVQKLNR